MKLPDKDPSDKEPVNAEPPLPVYVIEPVVGNAIVRYPPSPAVTFTLVKIPEPIPPEIPSPPEAENKTLKLSPSLELKLPSPPSLPVIVPFNIFNIEEPEIPSPPELFRSIVSPSTLVALTKKLPA